MNPTDVYLSQTDDTYRGTVEALDALKFSVAGKRVYIKPDLTDGRPASDGLTVDIGAVRAVLERLHDCQQITIGESRTNAGLAFKELEYKSLVHEFPNLQLEDMEESDVVWKPIPNPFHTKEMPLSISVFNHDYVINIAKMKTHPLAGVSLCLKNMFGFIPKRKQQLMYRPFIGKAILDINQLVPSHFCIVDGVWGSEENEMQSTPKFTGTVVAGEDILAVDLVSAEVMGINLSCIETYRLAFDLWGDPEVNLLGAGIDEVKTMYRQGWSFKARLRHIKETVAGLAYRAVNRH